MGAKSQRKGAGGERELMGILREHGYDIRRGGSLSFGEVPDLTGLDGIHIECKRAETLRLREWMQQAEADAQRFQDGVPIVIFRRSREPWHVVMKLSNWIQFYAKGQGCKCGGHCRKSPETAAEERGDTT